MDAFTASRIAWAMIAEPGDVLARDLCQSLGPEEALAGVLAPRSHTSMLTRLGREVRTGDRKQVGTWLSRYDSDRVGASFAQQRRAGIAVLDSSHTAWPARLDDLGDKAPLALWVRGNPEAATAPAVLAVVGSRRPDRCWSASHHQHRVRSVGRRPDNNFWRRCRYRCGGPSGKPDSSKGAPVRLGRRPGVGVPEGEHRADESD